MANEATLVQEDGQAMNYTCADGTGIEKGAILKLTTGNVAVLSSSANQIVAGICKTEKIASDGITSVSVYRNGRFRVLCHGTIATGAPVTTGSAANGVVVASVNDENILGYMLEDATEGTTKLMELRPTTMQLA